jgi:hypothetical protein
MLGDPETQIIAPCGANFLGFAMERQTLPLEGSADHGSYNFPPNLTPQFSALHFASIIIVSATDRGFSSSNPQTGQRDVFQC